MIGQFLDWEAERVVGQLYSRDHKGVILGADTIEYKNHHKRALILIHGWSDSPATFYQTAQINPLRNAFDIYVPRLPFHGMNLATMAQLDNDVAVKQLSRDIRNIADRYQSVTVVGHSYGGALIVEMIKRRIIPDHVNVVLYAPGINIKRVDQPKNAIGAKLYGLWRKYCNYPQLGCTSLRNQYDQKTRQYYANRFVNIVYFVMPSMQAVVELDHMNRSYLSRMSHPFSLIAVENDHVIDYDQLKLVCKINPACQFYHLSHGGHMAHVSNHAEQFNQLLLSILQKLTSQPSSKHLSQSTH
ncbi:alpha/beta hydrolase [Gammaproteobacteria bacterium]|nr:alpha/beta hydrolase [Gammaproteobacteria bacterium]